MDDAATDDGIQRGEGGAGGWGRGNPWKKFALTEKGRGGVSGCLILGKRRAGR